MSSTEGTLKNFLRQLGDTVGLGCLAIQVLCLIYGIVSFIGFFSFTWYGISMSVVGLVLMYVGIGSTWPPNRNTDRMLFMMVLNVVLTLFSLVAYLSRFSDNTGGPIATITFNGLIFCIAIPTRSEIRKQQRRGGSPAPTTPTNTSTAASIPADKVTRKTSGTKNNVKTIVV